MLKSSEIGLHAFSSACTHILTRHWPLLYGVSPDMPYTDFMIAL